MNHNIFNAYCMLARQLEIDYPDFQPPFDDVMDALSNAGEDFEEHNIFLCVEAEQFDVIKAMSFVGCRLFAFVSDEITRKAVATSLVKVLDDLASSEKNDGKAMNIGHLRHKIKLLRLESQCSHDVSLQTIWGHGFWRVGLYVSFISGSMDRE